MRSYSEFPNMIMDIEIAGVDVSKGIAISCGTIDNYLWTISVFHKESRKKINEIKVCLEEANLPLYITYVHALKSACANIGAIKLSDTAEALEAAGQRKDMDFIRTYNNKFLTDLEILLDSIDKVISAQSVENQACSADTELIKNELFRLKTAMDEYDIAVINETAKNLKVFLHAPNIGDILGQILQHKLHSEYDKAILLIDKILSDIH
jgi:HPt (histidine-containing phosphotransfer) domain-containing protein